MHHPIPKFVFEDQRLHLTLPGRIFVRVGAVIGYLAILVGTALALGSEILWLRWVGIFGGLFIADRILHARDGDVQIRDLIKKPKANLALALSPGLRKMVEQAFERSMVSGTDISLELVRVLLPKKDIRAGLLRLEVDLREFAGKTEDILAREESKAEPSRKDRVEELVTVLSAAFIIAAEDGHAFIQDRDVFAAIAMASKGPAERLFGIFDIEAGDLRRALIFGSVKEHASFFGKLPKELGGFIMPAERYRERVVNRAWTSRATPTLDRYGKDFNLMAARGEAGFLVGHEKEYTELVAVLSRAANPNALLVGDEGIGKESIIAHLAFAIGKDKVPGPLFDRRIVSLDLPLLTAGAGREEVQRRLAKIVEEIILAGNVILLVPDAHNLLKGEGLSLADTLLPIFRENAFPTIATTYPREHKSLIEPTSAFKGIFEVIRVEEISDAQAEQILVYQSLLLERRYETLITFGAVKMAVNLAKKYFRNAYLPGSAADLLKAAVARAADAGEKKVDHLTVVQAAEARVNVPLHEAGPEERTRLLNLEATLHKRVIGQDEAVSSVADAMKQYRSGLARKGGPIASFLFVGPTGVGKTELAKALAEAEFGAESALIRLDMSEYKDSSAVGRLIGAADGSAPGYLTEAIKKSPYATLLLDEFEKAHSEVLDLFLQVLDDGRLTDSVGTTVSFENAIVVATSNAHADILHDALQKGESVAAISDYVKQRLTDVFKPELLNRFSRIIVFRDLKLEEIRKIAAIELRKLSESVETQGLALEMGPEVEDAIARLGYDPAFGARNLKRAVDRHLRAPLAEFLLKENPSRGATIVVNSVGESFSFRLSS